MRRSPVGMAHVEPFAAPRHIVPCPQACADAKSVVRRRWLHVGAVKRGIAKQSRVHDTVEGAPAGVCDLVGRHQFMHLLETMHGDVFKANLTGARYVLVPLRQFYTALSWRAEPVLPFVGIETPHFHAVLVVQLGIVAAAVHTKEAFA